LRLLVVFGLLLLAAAAAAPPPARAQMRAEYRAFWVDTFNTTLNNQADVSAVVNNAKAANANAIFVQVRRRGDSWYLESSEPAPDFTPIAAGFDPLRDIIQKAHAEGIEVHAFVIMSAVWSKNPNFAPSATLGPPVSPDHVFNLHGGYDPATQKIVPGPNNWLTRTLIPDGTPNAGITFQGHRFGSDFWIDFGHPDAAKYTVDVVMNLVRNYDIDGLHLDRIRYPEIGISGQSPSTGTSVGYNATSVERFQRVNNIAPGSPPPAQNNPQWSRWRRDQVTNVVRRVYLEALAVKPALKVSAALIAFGGAPTCAPTANCKNIWETSALAEAYWRVYQDWRAWTEEGILDIAAPMNYKREHISAQATQFNSWLEWTKNNQYNRSAIMGVGNFVNSVEGTIRQVRRSLDPSVQGNRARGVIFFSMGTSNVFTNSNGTTAVANPFSVPPGQFTPTRSYAEFAAGLTAGKFVNPTTNATTLFEPNAGAAGYEAVFAQQATIPVLPWKSAPTLGHLKGIAKRADGTPLDTAKVTIRNLGTNAERVTATDGNGFFGGVDLAPGDYTVKVELGSEVLYSCQAAVVAGAVTTADTEAGAPVTTALPSPAAPTGDNGWYTDTVNVSLSAADDCSGVASTEFSTDGGVNWQPYTAAVTFATEGVHTLLFRSTDGNGNEETAKSLVIKIDKTAPTASLVATPSIIWPANNRPFEVSVGGTGADSVSGLASVSYVVTDEYGSTLSIPTRTLTGNSAGWTEALTVEASRHGDDRDGRLYRVTATVTDQAGHTATATAEIVVPHDRRAP